ncbi:MAG: hypothetical protein MJ158_02400 [Alphaproteobacteria bacterium]|nr:hypothetical protein [Alphaproteobacteria bacterium]
MPRIHIIGAPGSGKTTYAKKLAKTLNLPLYHLDEIYHDNSGKHSRKRSESERTAMAQEFASTQNWVSEGASFSDWVNPVLKRATEIHIVSPARIIRIYRQIKRYIKRKLGIEHSTYKETLHGLWNGIEWTWNYDRNTLPIILAKISKRTKIYKICGNKIKKYI